MGQSAQPPSGPFVLDRLDRRLIAALAERPRSGALELSRRLGIARNTVAARLERLLAAGVVSGFGPDIDLGRVGYHVAAFVSLEIAQGRGPDVTGHLASIPEVLEVHRTTGASDLLCRVAALSNTHLAEVLDRILEVPGINRTTTSLVLDTPVAPRVLPAIAALP
ncbi:MAG TPA: Lrp/AsnC family transcriptional regulator [Acidimicrobiales bacterium]|nr:Lrp/AsnC family transcriptional regulator [Acidimicrobiales bacterium]